MKIQKIQSYSLAQIKQNKNLKNIKSQNNTNVQTLPNAYIDYNINFRGRTPEDFYIQEFNIKNMPTTMKDYLNSDYEKNKHIPPEQIMGESFKYLNITENFEDIKSIYPNEQLFNNLHEPKQSIRTGIIAEIKDAKAIEKLPLFKNNDDDLGIYILRKIFLEGKTIKEINKNFYEKDINPQYIGVITEPITQKTTSAFGIQYPKLDFWNSFIATRDEYKKFFIDFPKQNKDELKKELITKQKNSTTKITSTTINKNTAKPTRKYKIKDYQKEHIKKEIQNHSKGNLEAIEKSIRKQFRQDDPEANFITKYFSPIMTIAADKIHLSEEETDFANIEKSKGKKIENLFYEFWKNKPKLLGYYSTAITDTIELFEERYAAGGNIPINKDFEVITDQTENKKVIDYVSQDFLDLLNYTQTIVPKRIYNKEMHNKLQKDWDEYFQWKYETLGKKEENDVVDKVKPTNTISEEELIENAALKEGAKVINVVGKNGENIRLIGNLDESLRMYIETVLIELPEKFINFITTKCLKSGKITENMKICAAIHTDQRLDVIDKTQYGDIEDIKKIVVNMTKKHKNHNAAATLASLEYIAEKSSYPESMYRFLLNTPGPNDQKEMAKMLISVQDKNPNQTDYINHIYETYLPPITSKEARMIANKIVEIIQNIDLNSIYDSKSVLYNKNEIIKMIGSIQKDIKNDPNFTKEIKTKMLIDTLPNYARALLNKHLSKAHLKAQQEAIVTLILEGV